MIHNQHCKNKWKSQRISKKFKNRHLNDEYRDNYLRPKENAALCIQQYVRNTQSMDDVYDNCYPQNRQYPSWICQRCTYLNIERNSHCAICQLSFNLNQNINNKSGNIDGNKNDNNHKDDILMRDYLEPILNEIESKRDDFDEQIQLAISLSLQDIATDSDDTDDNKSFISSSSNISTISDASSIENHKKRRIKKRGTSFASYWKNMTEYNILFQKNMKTIIKHNQLKIEGDIETKHELWPNHGHIDSDSYNLIKKHNDLMASIPTVNAIYDWLSIQYSVKDFNVRNIINPTVLSKFIRHGQLKRGQLQIVYHGTRSAVAPSICQRGLIVGGTKGVPISTGAAYGNGVYCSPRLGTASSYERGAMFICLVRSNKCRKSGTIYVVPNDDDILPMYLASFSYSGVSIANNTLFKFKPGWVPLNFDLKSKKDRRTRRKWSNYYKLRN